MTPCLRLTFQQSPMRGTARGQSQNKITRKRGEISESQVLRGKFFYFGGLQFFQFIT